MPAVSCGSTERALCVGHNLSHQWPVPRFLEGGLLSSACLSCVASTSELLEQSLLSHLSTFLGRTSYITCQLKTAQLTFDVGHVLSVNQSTKNVCPALGLERRCFALLHHSQTVLNILTLPPILWSPWNSDVTPLPPPALGDPARSAHLGDCPLSFLSPQHGLHLLHSIIHHQS